MRVTSQCLAPIAVPAFSPVRPHDECQALLLRNPLDYEDTQRYCRDGGFTIIGLESEGKAPPAVPVEFACAVAQARCGEYQEQ